MSLTAQQVTRAKPTDKTQKLFDGGGLYPEVTTTGAKRWQLKYRFAGKENLLSMGVFPAVSLKDARADADKARKLQAGGTDPSQHRQIEKATRNLEAGNTFEALALEWHGTKAPGWSTAPADTTMERLTKSVFPWIGRRPLIDINAPELLTTLRRIESRGAIDTTHRVKGVISEVFRYAIATGRALANPAAALKTTVKGHQPAIAEPKRFGQLLRDIDTYTGSNITRAALQIHALTFQRPNEVAGAQWAEVDIEAALWTPPGRRCAAWATLTTCPTASGHPPGR